MRNASDIVLQEKGLEEELNKYGWLGKFKDDILYRAIADVMIEDLFINNP
jgi:hypothetical protein